MNFHRNLLGLLPIVTVLATGACSSSSTTDAATTADAATTVDTGTSANTEVTNDGQIAAATASADTGEINAGMLAMTKATDSRVRDFAQMMVTDHTALRTTAATVAGAQGITPQANALSMRTDTENAAMATTLMNTPMGAAFDRAYVDGQVMMHQEVLDNFDTIFIPTAQNTAFKTTLMAARAKVADHLQMARTLQSQLGTPDAG